MIASLPATTSLIHPYSLPPLSTLRLLKKSKQGGRIWRGACRADLAQDAPFVAAIGACVINSIVFPVLPGGSDEDDVADGGALDSTDARFAVMGIISFIPYFNWLSWVFALLDSGRRRYAVYAVVYLVPYLRTNLSLSPEESWLPIASILLCILHVQIEASIRNGDLQSIQILVEARKLFDLILRKKESQFEIYQGKPKKGPGEDQVELPSAQKLRETYQDRLTPRKPVDRQHHLDEKQEVESEEQERD